MFVADCVTLVLQKAVKEKKAKDFGVKMIESKVKTFGRPPESAKEVRKPAPVPPSKVPEYDNA